jgi:3-phosphoshikimate 1-carboxyvinyltransferase
MSTSPSVINLLPAKQASGQLRLPGSKSISNRVLLLAALAKGPTRLTGLLDSDDTKVMRAALTQLGVGLEMTGPESGVVQGCGGAFPGKSANLFLGNAGTAIRPLTAALALMGGTYELSGVARMHERPIGDLVDGLRGLGANIEYLGNTGYPPLRISPATLDVSQPIHVRGDVSSQFLSALLLALPLLGKAVTAQVVGELISKPYVALTLNLLARFGVVVARDSWQRFHIPAQSAYTSPGTLAVEGDASSASYFLAAGALAGGPVRVIGVGNQSIQGDVAFADVLAQMGAKVSKGEDWIEVSAGAGLQAIDYDCTAIPDAAMTLAICALKAKGTTVLRGIGSWRVKETDRIAAMATELRKVGAVVEEGADYIKVTPPMQLTADALIATYDDHRMAMCFSLVSLLGVNVRISEPGCVAKTFPEYWESFTKIVSA